MAMTEAQIAEVYFFCGWPQRYVQINTAIEQAIDAIAAKPAQEALLTNGLTDSPVGLLAKVRYLYDVEIPKARKRLKARQVGKIVLPEHRELEQLAEEGRKLTGAICSCLGVERDADVFGSGKGGTMATRGGILSQSRGAGNWVGK